MPCRKSRRRIVATDRRRPRRHPAIGMGELHRHYTRRIGLQCRCRQHPRRRRRTRTRCRRGTSSSARNSSVRFATSSRLGLVSASGSVCRTRRCSLTRTRRSSGRRPSRSSTSRSVSSVSTSAPRSWPQSKRWGLCTFRISNASCRIDGTSDVRRRSASRRIMSISWSERITSGGTDTSGSETGCVHTPVTGIVT